jgi:hypothetical protein
VSLLSPPIGKRVPKSPSILSSRINGKFDNLSECLDALSEDDSVRPQMRMALSFVRMGIDALNSFQAEFSSRAVSFCCRRTRTLNKKAFDHPKQLVDEGKFVWDGRDAWSKHQPST